MNHPKNCPCSFCWQSNQIVALEAKLSHHKLCAEKWNEVYIETKKAKDELEAKLVSLSAQLARFQQEWPGGCDEVDAALEAEREKNAKPVLGCTMICNELTAAKNAHLSDASMIEHLQGSIEVLRERVEEAYEALRVAKGYIITRHPSFGTQCDAHTRVLATIDKVLPK